MTVMMGVMGSFFRRCGILNCLQFLIICIICYFDLIVHKNSLQMNAFKRNTFPIFPSNILVFQIILSCFFCYVNRFAKCKIINGRSNKKKYCKFLFLYVQICFFMVLLMLNTDYAEYGYGY